MSWLTSKVLGWLSGGLALALLASLIATGILFRDRDAKAERITTLEIAVQQAAQTLAQRDKQISDLTTTNDAQAGQTATQCAVSGSSSYLRGVEVGKVIGARQCAA